MDWIVSFTSHFNPHDTFKEQLKTEFSPIHILCDFHIAINVLRPSEGSNKQHKSGKRGGTYYYRHLCTQSVTEKENGSQQIHSASENANEK